MKPQLASRIPVVLDAIVDLLNEASAADTGPLKGVQVIDGPTLDLKSVKDDSIGVGPGTQDQPGAVSSLERQPGLGPNAYVERVEATMVLATYSGTVDMRKRRARASDLLAGVKAVIDDNQIRAGVWDQAGFGDFIDWFPTQNPAGCTIEVAFTIVTRSII